MIIDLSNVRPMTRTETLSSYYRDISRFKPLSESEEKACLRDFLHGNPAEKTKARTKLIEHNQRFVVAVAKHFSSNDNTEDLIQEGNMGLLTALDTYDESKGVKLSTWAVFHIRRSINVYMALHAPLIKRPNNYRTKTHLRKIVNAFVQENQRQPTPEEILELLQEKHGLKLENVTDVIETAYSSIDSFSEVDSNGDAVGLAAAKEYARYSSSENLCLVKDEDDYSKLMVQSLLDTITGKNAERDKKIIKMAFGIGYGRQYTNAEIGESVGLVTERVRQRINELLDELQKRCIELEKKI